MKDTVFILSAMSILALGGCATTAVHSPQAWAVPVTVASKGTTRHLEGEYTTYVVKDQKKRLSTVVSSANFKVGQCATLWRDASQGQAGAIYPRLSVAGEGCTPLSHEPDDIEGDYRYSRNQQWVLDMWLDSKQEALVAALGAPASSSTVNNLSFLTYVNRWAYTVDGWDVRTDECDSTFEIRDGFIFSYTVKGNCSEPEK